MFIVSFHLLAAKLFAHLSAFSFTVSVNISLFVTCVSAKTEETQKTGISEIKVRIQITPILKIFSTIILF